MKTNSFLSGCLTTLAVVAGTALFYHGCQRDRVVTDSKSETQIKYDTIPVFIDTPVILDSLVVRYKTIKVPVYDTIKAPHADTLATDVAISTDSASVVLPITQKHYRDSTYEAWVSGYEPALDSIRIFQPTATITNTITNTEVRYKPKRWGLGVQIGVGVTPNRIEPYVGIGVSYNIFSW